MANPILSVIIPTCHRPRDLAVCLDALRSQSPDSALVEVLVFDDGSSVESRGMVNSEFSWASWHPGPREGPAANRNAGAKIARGDWYVFLDDDCIPTPGYLRSYLNACGKSGADVLEGRTISDCEFPSLLWEAPLNEKGDHLPSCNFAIRASTFCDAGGFDARYRMAFEDMEFRARLREMGKKIEFLPSALVIHPIRPIPSALHLARRWEARVIYALDQGARPATILWRLPWHVLRIIQSRLRNQPLTPANRIALRTFVREWFLVAFLTPQWIREWNQRPRSPFWTNAHLRGTAVPKYGF